MRTRYVIEICAFASISVRHGDAGDAVTSPTLEKFSTKIFNIWTNYTAMFTFKWGSVYFVINGKKLC